MVESRVEDMVMLWLKERMHGRFPHLSYIGLPNMVIGVRRANREGTLPQTSNSPKFGGFGNSFKLQVMIQSFEIVNHVQGLPSEIT